MDSDRSDRYGHADINLAFDALAMRCAVAGGGITGGAWVSTYIRLKVGLYSTAARGM